MFNNKGFNGYIWIYYFFILLFALTLFVGLIMDMDKDDNEIFQNPPSEYEITINGTTEYRNMYINDNVYYGIDKEVAFDVSGDVLLIYTDGIVTGKSTDYTIRLAN